jgi:hypothetical protein
VVVERACWRAKVIQGVRQHQEECSVCRPPLLSSLSFPPPPPAPGHNTMNYLSKPPPPHSLTHRAHILQPLVHQCVVPAPPPHRPRHQRGSISGGGQGRDHVLVDGEGTSDARLGQAPQAQLAVDAACGDEGGAVNASDEAAVMWCGVVCCGVLWCAVMGWSCGVAERWRGKGVRLSRRL